MLFSAHLVGQQKDTVKNVRWYPVPYPGYSLETEGFLSAVIISQFTTTQARASNASIKFTITQREQYIGALDWTVYAPKEAFFSQGVVEYSKFPDNFYGIGSSSETEDLVIYSTRRTRLVLNGLFKIASGYLGPIVYRENFADLEKLNGEDSTFYQLYPGASTGLGVRYQKDTRDQILHGTDGYLIGIEGRVNTGPLGWYSRYQFDGRKYGMIGKVEWAARAYIDIATKKVPYFDAPFLGGNLNTRGLYQGRFRDQFATTFQFEVRRNLFWRMGWAFFGGVGTVANAPIEVFQEPWVFNYGTGFRFLLDKKNNTNWRLDVASSSDGQIGLYLSFGESF